MTVVKFNSSRERKYVFRAGMKRRIYFDIAPEEKRFRQRFVDIRLAFEHLRYVDPTCTITSDVVDSISYDALDFGKPAVEFSDVVYFGNTSWLPKQVFNHCVQMVIDVVCNKDCNVTLLCEGSVDFTDDPTDITGSDFLRLYPVTMQGSELVVDTIFFRKEYYLTAYYDKRYVNDGIRNLGDSNSLLNAIGVFGFHISSYFKEICFFTCNSLVGRYIVVGNSHQASVYFSNHGVNLTFYCDRPEVMLSVGSYAVKVNDLLTYLKELRKITSFKALSTVVYNENGRVALAKKIAYSRVVAQHARGYVKVVNCPDECGDIALALKTAGVSGALYINNDTNLLNTCRLVTEAVDLPCSTLHVDFSRQYFTMTESTVDTVLSMGKIHQFMYDESVLTSFCTSLQAGLKLGGIVILSYYSHSRLKDCVDKVRSNITSLVDLTPLDMVVHIDSQKKLVTKVTQEVLKKHLSNYELLGVSSLNEYCDPDPYASIILSCVTIAILRRTSL